MRSVSAAIVLLAGAVLLNAGYTGYAHAGHLDGRADVIAVLGGGLLLCAFGFVAWLIAFLRKDGTPE